MISRSKNISGRWDSILVAVFAFVIAGALLPMLPMKLPMGWKWISGTVSANAGDTDNDKTAKVIVGPNMLVTRDGEIPHVELMIAANPKDPKNLVGASITATAAEGGWACKTYSSHNGGDLWTDAVLPEQHTQGGGDPQVAFGPHGTAYFVGLTNVKDAQGNTKDAVYFYRSEDGGTTWKKPTDLGANYDHEVIAVDQSTGRFAGRIYISVLYGYPVYRLGIFRSDDDGRTFTGPVESANGGGKLGINTAANILILSDGTLIVPYEDFEFHPEKRKESHSGDFWIVSSSDGGVSFSSPHKIGTQEYDRAEDAPSIGTFPSFAADIHSKMYKDRIYASWIDYRDHKYRIWFSFSSDRGSTWSTPKTIDANVPESSWQYQPMVTVNDEGVVGVTWFDTRVSPDNTKFGEYFAASLDGGNSFLTPVRVSSEDSAYPGDGNLSMYPVDFNYKGEDRISFLSAASRWGMGGDYMGLTTDSAGDFHPFWADNRTGTSMIQTATIRVIRPAPANAGKVDEDDDTPKKPPLSTIPAELTQTDVTGRLELVFDPAKFNATTGELDMPIRLKNTSDRTVYGPIAATIKSFGSGMGEEGREYSPQVLNASAGGSGVGASFDFTPALGDSRQIAPGGVSGAIVWRLKISKPLKTPDLHTTLTGSIAAVK